MPVWTLHHTEPYPQRPYIFFAAFCEQETVNELDEEIPFPVGAEIATMQATHFRSGSSWEKLREERPELAKAVEERNLAVALHGTIAAHDSLDYLKQAVDIMAALVELGAVAVYDAITEGWYDSESWLAMVEQGAIFNPFDHVIMERLPQPDGRFWMRTRGLRKFARPDLSVRDVAAEEAEHVSKMLDRFVNHLALGGLPEPGREVRMEGWDTVYRSGEVQGGPEDPAFHNTYIEFQRLSAMGVQKE